MILNWWLQHFDLTFVLNNDLFILPIETVTKIYYFYAVTLFQYQNNSWLSCLYVRINWWVGFYLINPNIISSTFWVIFIKVGNCVQFPFPKASKNFLFFFYFEGQFEQENKNPSRETHTNILIHSFAHTQCKG